MLDTQILLNYALQDIQAVPRRTVPPGGVGRLFGRGGGWFAAVGGWGGGRGVRARGDRRCVAPTVVAALGARRSRGGLCRVCRPSNGHGRLTRTVRLCGVLRRRRA